ncbi:unnamed protein product [Zymoseptoria tritici ST99CH_3D7]|uniref:Uncharacterized protein n=1 Tax=Zymoseptoria tritici (strain ST99CH_3D7) TaxID=1276538 RepID=A0A1X7RY41_ZYMT9|nr:unnamed protein product [Zymoseptoria tritici ST99CH_3D7]
MHLLPLTLAITLASTVCAAAPQEGKCYFDPDPNVDRSYCKFGGHQPDVECLPDYRCLQKNYRCHIDTKDFPNTRKGGKQWATCVD